LAVIQYVDEPHGRRRQTALSPAPVRPLRGIFQHDGRLQQFLANAVRLGKIFGFLGGDACCDLRVDRGIRTIRIM